jgi:vacuolar-type H+-ATPase subunit F/Vma7
MGRVCAIGERALVEGYGLAGALVSVAEDVPTVRRAWHALPANTTIVILTPAAASAIAPDLHHSDECRLVVTLP